MATLLTQEQLEAFKTELQGRVDKMVDEGQSNLDWFKATTGSILSRTDVGTVKAAVISPLTGQEVVAETFPITKCVDRHFLETKAANMQPKVLGAFAEDYLREQLLARIHL